MSSYDWIKQLEVGNEVIIDDRPNKQPFIDIVQRITKTMIITTSHRFKKSNGNAVAGCIWHSSCIEEATPEAIKAIIKVKEKREAVQKVTDLVAWGKLYKLNISTLNKVIKVIEENKS